MPWTNSAFAGPWHMLRPARFVENSALPEVPSALIVFIHAKTGLSNACMGVCQVCRTNHFFRRGKCTSEKGIGNFLVKPIHGLQENESRLQLFDKETNIFFTNASAKCVLPYQIFIAVNDGSAPVAPRFFRNSRCILWLNMSVVVMLALTLLSHWRVACKLH